MYKSILKLTIIIYIILQICHVRSEVVVITDGLNDIEINNSVTTNVDVNQDSNAPPEVINEEKPGNTSEEKQESTPVVIETVVTTRRTRTRTKTTTTFYDGGTPQSNQDNNNNNNSISPQKLKSTTTVQITKTVKGSEPTTGKKSDNKEGTWESQDFFVFPNKPIDTGKLNNNSTDSNTEKVSSKKEDDPKEEEIKQSIEPEHVNTTNNETEEYDNPSSVFSNDGNQNSSAYLNPQDGEKKNNDFTDKLQNVGVYVIFIGAVSVGLVAVSGYRVYKKKNEIKGLKNQDFFTSSLTPSLNLSTLTPTSISENNPRASLAQSLIFDNESQSQAYNMYFAAKNNPYSSEVASGSEPQEPETAVVGGTLPYQSPKPRPQSQGSIGTITSTGSRSIISVDRNSIVRHSFLNPNLHIVRTGKRTQQLFEATQEHPAIIETFPSLERAFEPAVPVPLEESDANSLHPHSIYQMYQEEMEFENYYAYTIDDKEYIIDPTTNRVLEIHDLTTDEYVLVEEELYLDFSGSDDSDSEKQAL